MARVQYVDKMRGGGGQKMSVFVHAQGIKTVHAGAGGGGQKMATKIEGSEAPSQMWHISLNDILALDPLLSACSWNKNKRSEHNCRNFYGLHGSSCHKTNTSK